MQNNVNTVIEDFSTSRALFTHPHNIYPMELVGAETIPTKNPWDNGATSPLTNQPHPSNSPPVYAPASPTSTPPRTRVDVWTWTPSPAWWVRSTSQEFASQPPMTCYFKYISIGCTKILAHTWMEELTRMVSGRRYEKKLVFFHPTVWRTVWSGQEKVCLDTRCGDQQYTRL